MRETWRDSWLPDEEDEDLVNRPVEELVFALIFKGVTYDEYVYGRSDVGEITGRDRQSMVSVRTVPGDASILGYSEREEVTREFSAEVGVFEPSTVGDMVV